MIWYWGTGGSWWAWLVSILRSVLYCCPPRRCAGQSRLLAGLPHYALASGFLTRK